MKVAIVVNDKYGLIDIPSTYQEVAFTSGNIHSYIVGLEPHEVTKEMIFIPSDEFTTIETKSYPVWVQRKD